MRNSIKNPWLSALLGLVLGLGLGLLIGWVLWPVEWESSNLQALNPSIQEDYLRAAIDSYATNGDAQLAKSRYEALGAARKTILSKVITSPQNQDVETYAVAVDEQSLLVNPIPPSPTQSPTVTSKTPLVSNALLRLVLSGLIIIFLIITAGVFAFYLSSRHKKTSTTQLTFTDTGALLETLQAPTEEAQIKTEYQEVFESDKEPVPEWLFANDSPPQPEQIAHIAPFEEGSWEEPALPVVETTQEPTFAAMEEPPPIQTPAFFETELPESDKVVPPTEELPQYVESSPLEVPSPAEEEIASSTTLPIDYKEAAQMKSEMGYSPSVIEAEARLKFSREIHSIVGGDPVYSLKLKEAGIFAPILLLQRGASPAGREMIANRTGLSEDLIFKWVNQVDLLRIKGVDTEQVELLNRAGINSMRELASCEPVNLYEQVKGITTNQDISNIPTLEQLTSWIKSAKALPGTVH